jgi:putative DNA primase/helicase
MLALAKRVARTIHIEASATTDDRREKVGKWALTSGMLSRLKAMIACAAPAVAVTPEEFDARPELLNCRNGTLELDTLTFREARREDLLTKCCGVAYDPAAECPTWLAHLDLVFGGDAAYVQGFQMLCGYSLLQDNPEQIMAILYGTGKNGKSVTIGALARVWGDYAVNIAAESLMVKRSDGPRSDLARLHGARLVTASEGESGAYLAEGVVKQLTGDDAITVRRLYENEFEFRPGAKIFLATNHEPRIRGTDEGIWRRLWLLPFTVTIPEDKRDPSILDKLEAEGSGILNWCIEGLRRYQENDCRLAPPEKVLAATARFRSESDMVGRFLAQEMRVEPLGTIERTVLYKIYLKWCEDEGEKPVSNRAVIKYLRERGFGERKLGGAMCWTGIRIKSATEAEEDATEGSLQAGL